MPLGAALAAMISSYHESYRSRIEKPQEDYARNTRPGHPVLRQLIKEMRMKQKKVSTKTCPECSRFMRVISLEGINIDACPKCNSLWFDENELCEFTQHSSDVPGTGLRSRDSNYECPVCHVQMQEYEYSSHSSLLVDKCRNCNGVYLESGEFRRTLMEA